MSEIHLRDRFERRDILWIVCMIIWAVMFLTLLWIFSGSAVWAADALGTVGAIPVAPVQPTVFNLGPLIDWLKPLIVSGVASAAGGAVVWLLRQVFSYLHVTISDKDYDVIRRDATAQVQKLVAIGVDKLETVNVTIDSPLVKDIVTKMQASVPDIIKKLGLTPEKLAEIALAAIGQHQTDFLKASVAAPSFLVAGAPPPTLGPIASGVGLASMGGTQQ